jgi:hypothetical protein
MSKQIEQIVLQRRKKIDQQMHNGNQGKATEVPAQNGHHREHQPAAGDVERKKPCALLTGMLTSMEVPQEPKPEVPSSPSVPLSAEP